MKKLYFFIFVCFLLQSCVLNKSIYNYGKCPSNDPIGWHMKAGTGHLYKSKLPKMKH